MLWQYVNILLTKFVDINKGVPQGTVLGPILFSIMVNDIRAVNPTRNLLLKYADDITLSIPVRSNDIDPSLNEVRNIQYWASENRMNLNLKKTWEMVVRGKTRKPLPEPICDIERKEELTLLGVTFNEHLSNWNTHFDNMISKASSRLYILRVCKYFGYSLQELTLLFDSLIMSIFMYAIEVWASAYECKYLVQIDKFCRRAQKYGFTSKFKPILEIIKENDMQLWKKLVFSNNHCMSDLLPKKKMRILRKRGHNFILPSVKTERFKRCFINRCLFNFV